MGFLVFYPLLMGVAAPRRGVAIRTCTQLQVLCPEEFQAILSQTQQHDGVWRANYSC